MALINKSKLRQTIKDLDEEKVINNVAIEVEAALEEKIKEDLKKAISRARANQRRTLLSRDL